MADVRIIGVDPAKTVFLVHGAAADGSVVFRKTPSRPQFARFKADQPPCVVAMEACASTHPISATLGAGPDRARSRDPADRTAFRQTLREAAKERCSRCGGHRRGGAASDHALRRTEDGRAADGRAADGRASSLSNSASKP